MFSQLVKRFVTNNVVSLFHVQPFYRLWEHLKRILLDYVMWIIITNMKEIMQNVVIMIDFVVSFELLEQIIDQSNHHNAFSIVILVKMSNQQTINISSLENFNRLLFGLL
jgi:hypothetical protein